MTTHRTKVVVKTEVDDRIVHLLGLDKCEEVLKEYLDNTHQEILKEYWEEKTGDWIRTD